MVPDVISSSPPATAAALAARVGTLADDVLWPASGLVDGAERLPASHLGALASSGLLALEAPPGLGIAGLTPALARELMRRVGGACGATGFVLAQHHGVVAALAATGNRELRDRLLPALCRHSLAAISYAHVRRPGPPTLTARADGDGWTLDGEAPWVTSWGMAEVVMVAAVSADGRLVRVVVPGHGTGGMEASPPLALAVFRAGSTVRLRFDRHRVGPGDVVDVADLATWARTDRLVAARPNILCQAVGDRALALLDEIDTDLAAAFAPAWCRLGERIGTALDGLDRLDGKIGSLAALRAELVLAVSRLTLALVARVGGKAMTSDHPAQRLVRESMFYVVQAQSADGRDATLAALTP